MRTIRRQISDELDKLYSELDIVQSMSEESEGSHSMLNVRASIYPCLMKKSILLKTSLKNRKDIMAGSGTL